MSKISPCLWFADEAEEAAKFYVSLLPDSRIDKVQRSPSDYPGGKAGNVLVVQFTLAGQEYMALNGGIRSNIPTRSRSRSTAPTRPRSTASGAGSPKVAARQGNAAGSRIATV